MAYLVVLILPDMEKGAKVLEAWEAAGVSGITVLNSTGLGRLRRRSHRDDIPLLPSLANFLQSPEHHHQTFLSVVGSEELLDRVLAVTQETLGDMTRPDSGVIFAVPVSHAIGLRPQLP
jgi:nitrogen regulatory protein PII